jgi:hypothetical protein
MCPSQAGAPSSSVNQGFVDFLPYQGYEELWELLQVNRQEKKDKS